ncbi:MAG: ABC transporter substrate-binding protein [Chloroflexi bacterium]|nr:ABC transporter substrate-binding protein [Chloroflexota bacterium]
MQAKKRFVAVSLVVILSLLLASCAQGPGGAPPGQKPGAPTATTKGEQPRSGGTLNVSGRLSPEHWDVHQAGSAASLWPVGPVYSSLVRYNWENNEKIEADLAEKWAVSQDSKVYTFNLRQGVKWHDGKPFTSADVKFSLDRIRKPPQGVASPRKALMQSIKDIETPDASTVKITTDYADASLLTVIAMPWNFIFPKHVIEEKKDMKTSVVGTGPFMFKNYSAGVSFEVVKNPDYFVKGLPYLDGITRYYLTDSAKRFAAFRAGQVDAVEYGSFTATQADQLTKELPQVKVVDQRGVCWTSLYFNMDKKPWNDVRVRKAVSLAFDRQTEIKIALENRGDMGWVMPPTSMYALPQAELEKLPGFRQPKDADVTEAKKLLADAGLASGFKTDMVWRAEARYEPTATFSQNQFGKLGIDAQLRSLETAPLFDTMAKGGFDTLNFQYCITMTDPNDMLAYFVGGDPRNYSRYKDAEYDQWFKDQSSTLDTAKRKEIITKMQRKLLDTVPAIVLAWHAHIMGWYPKVRGFVPGLTISNNVDYLKAWLGG